MAGVTRTIAIANQKGGVAKTTTVASLGAALAEQGRKVLLVDLDAQSCLTFSLGLDPESVELSIHDVLLGRVGAAMAIQATEDGENALVEDVLDALGGAESVADLFAGLGTFALAAKAAYAAEASRDVVGALKRAAPNMTVEHRDLYRRPLDQAELKRFDAVILDPPRAGAAEQAAELARSSVARIAYVSCNPATFARDARTLVDGGYTLDWARPVGQFRWSTHVELAACFTR